MGTGMGDGLGANLRRERERRGFTQDAVAAKAGVSRNFIASVEIGRIVNPGVFTLRRVALALDVSLDALLSAPTTARAVVGRYTLSDAQRELEQRLALVDKEPFEPMTPDELRLYMPGIDYAELMDAATLAMTGHIHIGRREEPEWAAISWYAAGVLAMALVVENSEDN